MTHSLVHFVGFAVSHNKTKEQAEETFFGGVRKKLEKTFASVSNQGSKMMKAIFKNVATDLFGIKNTTKEPKAEDDAAKALMDQAKTHFNDNAVPAIQ